MSVGLELEILRNRSNSLTFDELGEVQFIKGKPELGEGSGL